MLPETARRPDLRIRTRQCTRPFSAWGPCTWESAVTTLQQRRLSYGLGRESKRARKARQSIRSRSRVRGMVPDGNGESWNAPTVQHARDTGSYAQKAPTVASEPCWGRRWASDMRTSSRPFSEFAGPWRPSRWQTTSMPGQRSFKPGSGGLSGGGTRPGSHFQTGQTKAGLEGWRTRPEGTCPRGRVSVTGHAGPHREGRAQPGRSGGQRGEMRQVRGAHARALRTRAQSPSLRALNA